VLLQRKDLYDLSDPVLPFARDEERRIMIDLLDIAPQHMICDVPAWTGYLAEGIINLNLVEDSGQITCIEPSSRFVQSISNKFVKRCAQQVPLPLADAAVDRLGSLVGMHHLPDKLAFLREARRVLRLGGRVVVSEVGADTAVARFLNGPVDRYTVNGHKGTFVRPGELRDLLLEAGFERVIERFYHLHWVFPSTIEMARFCRGLLGLAMATEAQVLAAITDHFALDVTTESIRLPWSLVYATGVKR
jgi:ubiquinone/menaquinone biosynthesis C-methylase UbiE